MKYFIKTYNTIKKIGLDCFSSQNYSISDNTTSPDAIVCRSAKLHDQTLHNNTKIIARAGVGVNNIPIDTCTQQGIVVCNTPGANSTSVKELVIATMIITSRNLQHSMLWTQKTKNNPPLYKESGLPAFVEQEKKTFVGHELYNKTIGIVGLGAIGQKLATACIALGMTVITYDISIAKKNMFLHTARCNIAKSLEELCAQSDYISLHIPYQTSTHHIINKKILSLCKKNCILLNFSRAELIKEDDLLHTLDKKNIVAYVTDFPTEAFLHHPAVLSIPHLGASTEESEENCAVMACNQICHYLESGTITHSVNFPSCVMEITKGSKTRLLIGSYNSKNIIAHITSKLDNFNITIKNITNKHKKNVAYTIIDTSETINKALEEELLSMHDIIFIRCITLQ